MKRSAKLRVVDAPVVRPTIDWIGCDILIVNLGMGVDSVAMLVEMHHRGIRPDMVVFAQVGNEWPETYAYIPIIEEWLARVGFPAITYAQYKVARAKHAHYTTLEENCIANSTLPSLAFGGRKACSAKWKGEPIDKLVRVRFAAEIAGGARIMRAIGYDAGACDAKRGTSEAPGPWSWIYPLRTWGMDRAACIAAIERAGLPVPHKSACFFCPSTKPAELLDLAANHPELATRAVVMEDRAQPNLTKILGLWGRGTKGMRGAEKKPGAWRTFLAEHAPHVLPENVGKAVA